MKLNKINLPVTSVYAIGDIHGNYHCVANLISSLQVKGACFIICGDCGFGFDNVKEELANLEELNDTARDTGNYVVMVRGNHDNPDYFNSSIIDSEYVMAVPDYTVLNGKFLMIGGAISIDRTYRKNRENMMYETYKLLYDKEISFERYVEQYGRRYWADESVIYDAETLNQLKTDGISIEYVCTHTCPSFCPPQGKEDIQYWLCVDKELEKDLDDERERADRIYHHLKNDGHQLKSWTYGHFHGHNTQIIDGIQFTMLDMSRSYENLDYILLTNE